MDGQDDDGRRAIRWGRRRFQLTMLAASLLGVVAAGLLIGLGTSDVLFREGNPPGWVGILGVVLSIGGLAGEIVALVWLSRSGWYRRNRQSRLWAVGWRRRQELIRQVRRGGPVPDGELPQLRRLAEQMAEQTRSIWVQAGLVTFFVGQALMRFTSVWAGLAAGMAIAFGGAWWQMRRDARRAEAFLRTHPVGQNVVDVTD